ncbi:N-acetylmuramoyl-L-alanine amidase [Pseudohoeflea coraliihabitans]|uniref:N-acetylmuramoyl-L-alanine amidase n=1 Tax=Pseudohoeflea coraliihabitans TaxID=2860393 RepID=A0ABS6WU73_9HYPH|nr:N-acetylmuramoyl-L-alanine amidase [Pseudohoeflea sp. DP4N28-3]MBW3098609.1 N-acetylmuramoyl-L-alanine amidase [Pseudohoeflea sp. DP4N28-3]
MQIENNRLVGADNQPVRFVAAAHSGSAIVPRYIVMHYTAGGAAAGTVRYFASPGARASAHFVVSRQGAIVQQVACDRAAWHAGRSRWRGIDGLNAHSIGVELANWGLLQRGPDGFVSHAGVAVDRGRVAIAAHRNGPAEALAWERFAPVQVEAAAELVAALMARYGLGEEAIIGHDDIAPGRKIDPGPAFDMRAFRGLAAGRGTSSPPDCPADKDSYRQVRAANGLNLRSGPGLQHPVIGLLSQGSLVRVVSEAAPWAFVTRVKEGCDGVSGFAHSAWLTAPA